ncbi:MAG: hypothetical protein Q7R35_06020 [Elusimicrobiota bacterium]|nr:hypothetical protein [Elusimicrobiota bacterium]
MKRILFLSAISIFFAGCCCRNEQAETRTRYTRGKVENFSAEELKLEKALKEAAKIPAAVEFAKGLFDAVYITLEEHEGTGFTVRLRDGGVEVERGLNVDIEPTLVVPLTDEGVLNIKEFFKDGKLDDTEEFLVINALFKPGWEASYRIPDIGNWLVRKYMRLDGLLHAVLLNPGQVKFKGKAVKNELSVVRVSKQWLIFSGLEGLPDTRMEIAPKDAIAMYSLIMRDLKSAKGLAEKREVMRKFTGIRDRCILKK